MLCCSPNPITNIETTNPGVSELFTMTVIKYIKKLTNLIYFNWSKKSSKFGFEVSEFWVGSGEQDIILFMY